MSKTNDKNAKRKDEDAENTIRAEEVKVAAGLIKMELPQCEIVGERISFSDGFLLSYGSLTAHQDLEYESNVPSGTEFHLYSHQVGHGKFLSNDFPTVKYDRPQVTLFRHRENPGGVSKVPAFETVRCFEIQFSLEKLEEWLGGEPPKNLHNLLQDHINRGYSISLPKLNSYFVMQQSIEHNPYIDSLSKLYKEGAAMQMVATYLEHLSEKSPRDWPGVVSSDKRKALHAREILLSNLDKPLELNELARLVGVAPRRLNIIFNEVFGHSVFQMLTREKLERARMDLENGSATIKEAAYQAGYNHTTSFSAAFKKMYGQSPSEVSSYEFKALDDD